MKRTFLFSMLAVVSAALMPLPAAGQVNPEAAPGPEQGATYKYEVYGGRCLYQPQSRCPCRATDCWAERRR